MKSKDIQWNISSWKDFEIKHLPIFDNKKDLENVKNILKTLPSLVFSGETRKLKQELLKVHSGNAFILQVGDCSESFSDCNGPKIHNFLRIIMQMSLIIGGESNLKIVKIGRVAGQYAKPRSSDFEEVNGVILPVYRGDMINDFNQSISDRLPNPKRILDAYFYSAATLNLIRAFTQGGYTDIQNILDWKFHFYNKDLDKIKKFGKFEKFIENSLIKNTAIKLSENDIVYTSHEALLLDYEECFTRIDTLTGDFYNTSAHTFWIGDRTRFVNSAHIEFARGVRNPVGIKVGPKTNIKELVTIIKTLNPKNEPDKIMLILRLGKESIKEKMSKIIYEIKKEKLLVIWCCDPMHGNTFTHNGIKVRSFNDIVFELKSFFKICKAENIIPGGVHLEITGEYVSECIGGACGMSLHDITRNYASKVDPRLNAAQAIEIALIISELLHMHYKK